MTVTMRAGCVGMWICLTMSFAILSVACQSPLQIYPVSSSCGSDNDLPAKEREGAEEFALQFVKTALGPDTASSYSLFSTEAKREFTSNDFVAMFQRVVKPMGPYENLHVAHTYIAKAAGGIQDQRVVCGNLGRPDGWVSVNVKPGPAQAHVLVEGQTVNNTSVFVLWLFPEQGNWRVQYVHFTTAGMVGKSAVDLQAMAESERQKQHSFNAYVLDLAALQLADFGPYFQLGIRPDIQKEIAEEKVPSDLQGQPPFTWNAGKSAFKVLNVGPIGVGGKIYLMLDHEIESWPADKEVEKINRELITAFTKAHPEYPSAFSGLIVRAHERGGSRGVGTVQENPTTLH